MSPRQGRLRSPNESREQRGGETEGAGVSSGAQPLEESAQGRGEDGALHPSLWPPHERQLQLEAFRCIYGSAVARELIPVEARITGGDDPSCSLEDKGARGGGNLEGDEGDPSGGRPSCLDQWGRDATERASPGVQDPLLHAGPYVLRQSLSQEDHLHPLHQR